MHEKELRKYIAEKHPELGIMEKRIGAEVILKGDAWHEYGILVGNGQIRNYTQMQTEDYSDRWEILGRPLTLSDVLYALSNKRTLSIWYINEDGESIEEKIETGPYPNERKTVCRCFLQHPLRS
jgi:hypothetical protein